MTSRLHFKSLTSWTLALVLLLGTFLRLPPRLFEPTGCLHALARVHPQPGFKSVGFDEGLYQRYVEQLSATGLTSYPDIAEAYVETQKRLPGAILPPTRFIYIACGYTWHSISGIQSLDALKDVASTFSILLLGLAAIAAHRLGGPTIGLAVTALSAVAPMQVHMAQHALIDGVFAFWAVLCFWLLWENLHRSNDWRWLGALAFAVAGLVLAKENAFFAYVGLLAALATAYFLKIGEVTRSLVGILIAGGLAGAVALVALCGSLTTTVHVFQLLASKASVLPYAIRTGDGPWYRYLVDLLLISPVVLLLSVGRLFTLRRGQHAEWYCAGFIVGSYAVMCNVRYGMNLRYALMWDLPLRYLAISYVAQFTARFRGASYLLAAAVALLCIVDLRQYQLFFVNFGLYELVSEGLLRALHILK